MASNQQPICAVEYPNTVSAEYDSPMLVRIDATSNLLQGPTYTRNYRDCQATGTTDFNTC